MERLITILEKCGVEYEIINHSKQINNAKDLNKLLV